MNSVGILPATTVILQQPPKTVGITNLRSIKTAIQSWILPLKEYIHGLVMYKVAGTLAVTIFQAQWRNLTAM